MVQASIVVSVVGLLLFGTISSIFSKVGKTPWFLIQMHCTDAARSALLGLSLAAYDIVLKATLVLLQFTRQKEKIWMVTQSISRSPGLLQLSCSLPW